MALAVATLMLTVRASHSAEAAMLPTDLPGIDDRPLRALALDADDASLARLAHALEACGLGVSSAADGEEGLARLLDELLALDALVLPLDLPGRDARAFARLVRDAGNERDLALIVVADAPTPALRLELRGLGIDAIVDRHDGSAEVAGATLRAIAARRGQEEAGLPAWRNAPAAAPLGETSWRAAGGGGLAAVA